MLKDVGMALPRIREISAVCCKTGDYDILKIYYKDEGKCYAWYY